MSLLDKISFHQVACLAAINSLDNKATFNDVCKEIVGWKDGIGTSFDLTSVRKIIKDLHTLGYIEGVQVPYGKLGYKILWSVTERGRKVVEKHKHLFDMIANNIDFIVKRNDHAT